PKVSIKTLQGSMILIKNLNGLVVGAFKTHGAHIKVRLGSSQIRDQFFRWHIASEGIGSHWTTTITLYSSIEPSTSCSIGGIHLFIPCLRCGMQMCAKFNRWVGWN